MPVPSRPIWTVTFGRLPAHSGATVPDFNRLPAQTSGAYVWQADPRLPFGAAEVSRVRVALVLIAAIGFAVGWALERYPSAPSADARILAFRACMAKIPHPREPILILSMSPVARQRALAMARYEHDCTVESGVAP